MLAIGVIICDILTGIKSLFRKKKIKKSTSGVMIRIITTFGNQISL